MRDPQGRVRFDGERVLRDLFSSLPREHFLHSDLAARLVRERRMLPFAWCNDRLLESPRLPFVSQPSEWCDAQLHAAGQLTLELQRDAVDAGFDLKDASAWNVLFDGCRPVLCDLLSFEQLATRKWWAMGQYARHFVFPLLASKYRAMKGHEVFSAWRDGLPAGIARRLLGRGIFFTRYGMLFLGSDGNPTTAHSSTLSVERGRDAEVGSFRRGLHGALDWMMSGLVPSSERNRVGWSGYEGDRPHYAEASLDLKRLTVERWMANRSPAWVLDLGCNTGEFSQMALRQGANVVALDADHESVQRLYRAASSGERLYPLVARLDDIGGGRGWAGTEHPGLAERLAGRFDAVLMLALVHHLMVAAAVPVEEVARFAHRCTRDVLVVELIAETDPQLVSLCAQRGRNPLEFSLQRQRQAFLDAGFCCQEEVHLAPAHRSLVLLSR